MRFAPLDDGEIADDYGRQKCDRSQMCDRSPLTEPMLMLQAVPHRTGAHHQVIAKPARSPMTPPPGAKEVSLGADFRSRVCIADNVCRFLCNSPSGTIPAA